MPKKHDVLKPRIDRIRGDNRYMSFLAELREIVAHGMEVEALSVAKMAENANLSPVTVRNFLKGDTVAPQLPTVHWLLRGVYVSLTTDAPNPPKRRGR